MFKLFRLKDHQRNTIKTAAGAAMFASQFNPSEQETIVPELDISVQDPSPNINFLDFGRIVKPTPFQASSTKQWSINSSSQDTSSDRVSDTSSLKNDSILKKGPKFIKFAIEIEDTSKIGSPKGAQKSILKTGGDSRFCK